MARRRDLDKPWGVLVAGAIALGTVQASFSNWKRPTASPNPLYLRKMHEALKDQLSTNSAGASSGKYPGRTGFRAATKRSGGSQPDKSAFDFFQRSSRDRGDPTR